jgi:uncharacterized membrane protein YbhN (UPF0104 family)
MKPDKRSIILLAVMLVAIYVLLPQLSDFHSSVKYLSHPKYAFLAIGLGLSFLTFLAAGTTYVLLSFKPIKIRSEYLIQLSSFFINNLLPAGIGGLGANYAYLKHKKHSTSQATTVVATNNTLGIMSHLTIVVCTLTFISPHSYIPSSSTKNFDQLIKISILVVVIGLLVFLAFGRRKLIKLLSDIKKQLASYKDRPQNILAAYIVQVCLSFSNMMALYFCAKAVNINISIATTVLIYTVGAGIKNATPTPGGIGGYEAALLATFVAYKINSAHALSAIIFFRIVILWIPLLVGLVAFTYAQKKKLYSS